MASMYHLMSTETKDRLKKVPWYYAIISTFLGTTLTHPLDLVRVNVQANAIEYVSARKTLRKMIRFSGIRGFYFAFTSSLMRNMIISSTWFVNYHAFKHCTKRIEHAELVLGTCIVYGLITPFMKAGLAMQADLMRVYKHNYKNIFDALRKMYRRGGLPYLYQGYDLQALYGIFISFGQLPIYDYVYRLLQNPCHNISNANTKLIASSVSLTIVWILFTPLLVVRCVIMNANWRQYRSSWHAFRHIRKVHGYSGFYIGIRSTLIRIIPLSYVVAQLYELIVSLHADR